MQGVDGRRAPDPTPWAPGTPSTVLEVVLRPWRPGWATVVGPWADHGGTHVIQAILAEVKPEEFSEVHQSQAIFVSLRMVTSHQKPMMKHHTTVHSLLIYYL